MVELNWQRTATVSTVVFGQSQRSAIQIKLFNYPDWIFHPFSARSPSKNYFPPVERAPSPCSKFLRFRSFLATEKILVLMRLTHRVNKHTYAGSRRKKRSSRRTNRWKHSWEVFFRHQMLQCLFHVPISNTLKDFQAEVESVRKQSELFNDVTWPNSPMR